MPKFFKNHRQSLPTPARDHPKDQAVSTPAAAEDASLRPRPAPCWLCGTTVDADHPPAKRSHEHPVPWETYECGSCLRTPNTVEAGWRDVIATCRPPWLDDIPWPGLETARRREHPAVRLPAAVPSHEYWHHPPARDRWAHVHPDHLFEFRAVVEHAYWPTRPPTPADERERWPAAALREWPEPVACWRCGQAVPTGEGNIRHAASPTEQWKHEPEADRERDPADRDRRVKDRATAPTVDGAAWRECPACSRGPRLLHTRRLLAATDWHHPVATADLLADWARPALAAMPWPVYAAHPSCTGPRDAGTAEPYAFADADWWAGELARQLEHRRPPHPHRPRTGLPCQVCGTPTATGWDTLGGDPICGTCRDQFAPKPPPDARDAHASRASDRRPTHHDRGNWDLTWDLHPVPDDWSHLPRAEQLRAEDTIRICDRDLICAAAAYRPELRQPGLAREVGFTIAREHPHYRHSPAWSGPWAYLADNPHGQDRDTLVTAVGGLLSRQQPAPTPMPPARPAPTAAERERARFPKLTEPGPGR